MSSRYTLSPSQQLVTSENLQWMRATVMVLNFLYCRGRLKPTGVPMAPSLCENQKEVIRNLGKKSNAGVHERYRLPTLEEVKMLKDENVEELGAPVRVPKDLHATKIIAAVAAWSDWGHTSSVSIASLLDGRLLEAVRDPTGCTVAA